MNRISFTDCEEPVLKKVDQTGLSAVRVYFSLFKSMINTGILYQPKSFYLGGALFSSIACIGVGILTLVPVLWLSKANDRFGGTYAEIAGRAMGKPGLYMLEFVIVVTQFGPAAINVGFIVELTLTGLSIFSVDTSPYIIMAILYLLLVPLCLIKSLKDQSWIHVIADAIIISSIFIIGIFSSANSSSTDITIVSPKYMVYAIGTIVYAYEGIPLLLPIKETMRNPSDFGKVFTYLIITVIVLFLWFSNACIFSYGNSLKDMVILNLPHQAWVAMILFAYCFAICLTIPLTMNPVFTIIEKYLKAEGNKIYVSRVCVITCTIIIGTSARNYLGLCASIIGGVFAAPIAFVFPAIIHLKLNAESQTDKNKSWAVIVIGVVFTLAAIFNSIYINIQ